jgi:hypothetical protein
MDRLQLKKPLACDNLLFHLIKEPMGRGVALRTETPRPNRVGRQQFSICGHFFGICGLLQNGRGLPLLQRILLVPPREFLAVRGAATRLV